MCLRTRQPRHLEVSVFDALTSNIPLPPSSLYCEPSRSAFELSPSTLNRPPKRTDAMLSRSPASDTCDTATAPLLIDAASCLNHSPSSRLHEMHAADRSGERVFGGCTRDEDDKARHMKAGIFVAEEHRIACQICYLDHNRLFCFHSNTTHRREQRICDGVQWRKRRDTFP